VRNRLVLPLSVSLALALTLAACGSSAKPGATPPPSTSATAPSTSGDPNKPATNVPSVSAKMICESEAKNDIYTEATGVRTISAFKPTWVDHVYSCNYVYPSGEVMTLSVKELSNEAETTAYFDMLAQKLGKTKDQAGIGQGAFSVKDGSIVVRKDYKVLLVDVSKLPANFGVPSDTRSNIAINVAVAILGCWTGA